MMNNVDGDLLWIGEKDGGRWMRRKKVENVLMQKAKTHCEDGDESVKIGGKICDWGKDGNRDEVCCKIGAESNGRNKAKVVGISI